MLHDLVDHNDKVYQLLLLLRYVVYYIMAPALSFGQVACMKTMIDDYIERRQELFSHVPLRPKHHYMSHYPWLTLKFGPLVRLWTLRFEAKHQYFKRCIRNSHNFVNLSYMLARRHQLLQAYLSEGVRFSDEIFLGKRGIVLDSALTADVCSLLEVSGIASYNCYADVTIRGQKYSQNCVLPVALPVLQNAVFAQVLLVVVDGNVKFLVKLRLAEFDFKVGCYYLTDNDNGIKIVQLDDFLDYHPLNIYIIKGNSFIVLKHQFLDKDG
jgi:hypothetical protein